MKYIASVLLACSAVAGPAPARADAMMNVMPGLDREFCRLLQLRLTDKGYAVGAIDGRCGPRTTRAVDRFRNEQGNAAEDEHEHEFVQAPLVTSALVRKLFDIPYVGPASRELSREEQREVLALIPRKGKERPVSPND